MRQAPTTTNHPFTFMAHYKFPKPTDCKVSDKALICPAQRVIALYNQDSGRVAKRIAKRVQRWFRDQAQEKGWAGCYFLKEVQSSHGAGCILWRRSDKVGNLVKVTESMLILSKWSR